MGERKEHLRICFIPLMFSPLVGGAEIQAEKQARQLQKLGHAVTIVTLHSQRSWERKTLLDGLPVVRVGGIYKSDGTLRIGRLGIWPVSIGMFLQLWQLRHTYDVIHVFQVTPLAAMAVLIGKLTGKPVIIGSMGVGPTREESSQPRPEAVLMADTLTERSFLKIAPWNTEGSTGDINGLLKNTLGGRIVFNFLRRSQAYFQALSTRSSTYLVSWGIRREQIVYIPGSVDSEKFRPSPEHRPDPDKPERMIICVARLEHVKGIDVLLHAWGRMISVPSEWRAHLNPRLCIVGIGRLRPQLERIVAELNIQDSVEFLGLRLDVVDLLQRSWGFVLPSRNEGMPNALLEAMACGLPCIATRVSGSEDIIVDGFNGILVEPEQPAQMAHALHRLIEETELAQRLGQEGHATVVRDYQLIHAVQRCLELYWRLLAKNNTELSETVAEESVASVTSDHPFDHVNGT
jgi:glycosyltransferase involved in cell wall biosynthesis